jgi:excisionase family DNA binding protein
MLNTAEAARFLRVSQASIRRWADSGRLPSRRVGGRRERRFLQTDLLAFLEEGGGPHARDRDITVGGAVITTPYHIAILYTSDEARLRISAPFLAEGLRLGQPCLLVADEAMASVYAGALGAGDNPLFMTFAFRQGTAAKAIVEWERRLGDLVAGGAGTIRIVGEIARERKMFDSEEELFRYEEAFELMSKRYPVAVICQYDAREFSGLALVRAMKAHPDLFNLRLGLFLH